MILNSIERQLKMQENKKQQIFYTMQLPTEAA